MTLCLSLSFNTNIQKHQEFFMEVGPGIRCITTNNGLINYIYDNIHNLFNINHITIYHLKLQFIPEIMI